MTVLCKLYEHIVYCCIQVVAFFSWNGIGENHLIWNMIPGSPPDYNTVIDLALGNALIAGAGFDSWTYRVGFDISLPLFSPFAKTLDVYKSSNLNRYKYHSQIKSNFLHSVEIYNNYFGEKKSIDCTEQLKMNRWILNMKYKCSY